jgi:hypothetical protein
VTAWHRPNDLRLDERPQERTGRCHDRPTRRGRGRGPPVINFGTSWPVADEVQELEDQKPTPVTAANYGVFRLRPKCFFPIAKFASQLPWFSNPRRKNRWTEAAQKISPWRPSRQFEVWVGRAAGRSKKALSHRARTAFADASQLRGAAFTAPRAAAARQSG